MQYVSTLARYLRQEFLSEPQLPAHERLLNICSKKTVNTFLRRTRTRLLALIEHGQSILDDPVEAATHLGIDAPKKVRKGGVKATSYELSDVRKRRGWNDKRGYQELLAAHQSTEELPFLPYALDPGLSPLGIRQAASLRPFIACIRKEGEAHRHAPDFSSHLLRTKQTGAIAGMRIGDTHELSELGERIMEPQHGLSGTEINTWYPEIGRAIKEGKEIVAEGVEPMSHFEDRVESTLLQLTYESLGSTDVIAAVTHQTLIKLIAYRLASPRQKPANLFDQEIENGSVTLMAVRAAERNRANVPPPSVTDLRFSPFHAGGWQHSHPSLFIEGAIIAKGVTFPLPEKVDLSTHL